MRNLSRISSIILSFVALLFVLTVTQAQTTDTLQVLKKETALSKRKLTALLTTTYGDYALNSCTLSFTQKTLQGFNDANSSKAFNRISKYIFPLKSMDAKLEWLATYNSFVISFSGPGSIFNIETNYKGAAPNISIPFVNEDSAKKVEIALQREIAACGGKKDPVEDMNRPAGHNSKASIPDVNDEMFNVKVNVDLVMTDVTVTGDNVPELRAEDFLIYDNSVAQQISYFSHDQRPISVAVLLQPACSTWSEGFEQYIAALSSLRLLKPNDEVALFSLTGDRLSNLTDDRLHIANLLNYIADVQNQYADVYGTLYDAVRYLKQETSSRRIIILISHNCHTSPGSATGSDATWSELRQIERTINNLADRSRIELLESATTLYDVVIQDLAMLADYLPQMGCKQSSQRIKMITQETGGEVFVVQRQMSLRNELEQAIDQLRTQYTLGFIPSNPGENGSFHELTVRLANKDRHPTCKIKARPGYYAGVAAPLTLLKRIPAKPSQSSSEIDNKLIQQSIVRAGCARYDLDEVPFDLTNAEQMVNSNGQSLLKVDLLINSVGIDTRTSNGRRAYSMQAAFFYTDKKGNLLGSYFGKIEGSLNEEAYSRITAKGIPFSAMIPLKIKNQNLRIVVYDERSGRIGSRFIKRNGKSFTLDPHPIPSIDKQMPGPPQPPLPAGAPFSSQ
jgi:Ca-activated chloride channel homolog